MSTILTFDRARALLTPPPPYTAPIAYSIGDVERLLGVSYAPGQRQTLEAVPFSEETLRACAGTHMLFPGFPLSLLGLRKRQPDVFFVPVGGWYADDRQAFSRRKAPLRWHLLRTGPVPGSLGKAAIDQPKMLPGGESIPGVAEVALAAVLHKLASSQQLFGTAWYRTADQDASGDYVAVVWDGGRLDIGHWLGGGGGGRGWALSAQRPHL